MAPIARDPDEASVQGDSLRRLAREPRPERRSGGGRACVGAAGFEDAQRGQQLGCGARRR